MILKYQILTNYEFKGLKLAKLFIPYFFFIFLIHREGLTPTSLWGVGVCLHVLGMGRTHVCADRWMCFCVCMLCICMCVCCMSVCMHLCPSLCGCVHVHIFVWMCVMCSFGAIEMTAWLKLMSKRRKMTFYLFIFKKSSINYL